uniref:Uncharacterized protein n=1 Tax=Desulfobacca acetoxidans TaxID=60893 RepID=A0A7C3SJ38_9BACT
MSTGFASWLGLLAVGLAAGIFLTLAAIRAFGTVHRLGKDTAVLQLPLRTSLEVRWLRDPDGLYIYEAEEVLDKITRLSRLLDFQWLLPYAKKYRISYIGLKDSASGYWKPGSLACSTLDFSPQGGYKVFLNPGLSLEETARRLSQELGVELQPAEVHKYLFLHEIGHTSEAGNICFISAAINSALSGGRRTHRRRKELQLLRQQVEKYADQFAVAELLKHRNRRGIP